MNRVRPLPGMMLAAVALVAALVVGTSVLAQDTAKPQSQFITLGTQGGPVADPRRSQPANALVVSNDVYLIDVGDGEVQQMAKARIALGRVNPFSSRTSISIILAVSAHCLACAFKPMFRASWSSMALPVSGNW